VELLAVARGPRDQLSTKEEQRHLPGPARACVSSSGRSGSGPQHFPWKESVPNIGEIYGGVSAPNIV